jgi:hypothetical protein
MIKTDMKKEMNAKGGKTAMTRAASFGGKAPNRGIGRGC